MTIAMLLAAAGALFTFAAGYAFARRSSSGEAEARQADWQRTLAEHRLSAEAQLHDTQRRREDAESARQHAEQSREAMARRMGLQRAPMSAPQTLQSLVGSTAARAAVVCDREGLEWAGVGRADRRERLASLGVAGTELGPDDILVARTKRGDAILVASACGRALVVERGPGEPGLFAFERSLVELRRGDSPTRRIHSPLPVRATSHVQAMQANLRVAGLRSVLSLGTTYHEGTDLGGGAPSTTEVAILGHLFEAGQWLGMGPIASVEWRRPSGTMLVVPAEGMLIAASFEQYALDDAEAEQVESLIGMQTAQEAA